MIREYDDIINLPRHISNKRSPMAIKDRAAQFSPFAALTGHDGAIKETARVTEKRVELDEYMKVDLSKRLQIIANRLDEDHEISITYFQPDQKKDGGAYVTDIGVVKKIDEYGQIVLMTDGTEIPINEIISIDGQILETIDNTFYKE